MELHWVILEDDVAVDARKHGKEIARILDTTLIECRMVIRRGRGIFLEDISKDQAEQIVDLLDKDGIRAKAVPAEEIPILPQPRRVGEIERGDEVFNVRFPQSDEIKPIPWSDIDIVSSGAVALPKYEDMFSKLRFDQLPGLHTLDDPEARELLRENMILKLDPIQHQEADTRKDFQDKSPLELIDEKWGGKIRIYADLIPKDRSAWYRLAMDEFAYIQTAGSVKLGGAWGFSAFMDDLHEKVADAFSQMSLLLSSHGDIKHLVFPTIEEFNRYSTWVILKPAGPPQPPEPQDPFGSPEEDSPSPPEES